MDKDLDDDIVSVQAPSPDEDDDIVEVTAAPSFLSKIGGNIQSFLDSSANATNQALDYTGETLTDAAIGGGQGLTFGLGDEIGAGITTGIDKLFGAGATDRQLREQGFDIPEEEIYRQYQEAGEKAQDEAFERSPIANIVGQIGGSALTGVAAGAAGLGVGAGAKGAQTLSQIAKNEGMLKALGQLGIRGGKSYIKASPLIALESAATSKEDLIGPNANPMGVAADVAGGQIFGLGAMLGLEGISGLAMPSVKGKIDDITSKVKAEFADEDNPRLRQMAKSYLEYGRDLGIHPRSAAQNIKQAPTLTSEQAQDILKGRLGLGPKVDPSKVQVVGKDVAYSLKDGIAADQLQSEFGSINKKLGKNVGNSLEQATSRGALIDVNPVIENAAVRLDKLSTMLPDLAESRKASKAYDKILNTKESLTPTELKHLIDDLDYSYGEFQSATQLRPGETNIAPELLNIRKQLSDLLKKEVPEYRGAAEQFEGWRQVLEQLAAVEKDPQQAKIFLANLSKPDLKINEALIKLIGEASSVAASSSKDQTAFSKFMNKLGEFEALDIERAKMGLERVSPRTQDVRKFILNASDDANLRNSVRATTESRSIVPDLKEAIVGKAPTSGAYWAGKLSKNLEKKASSPLVKGVSQMSKLVFNAPAQSISNLASRLETSGSFQLVGKALREAVENGDTAKKNAALFTIMQNPNARAFISAEDFPDEENKEE